MADSRTVQFGDLLRQHRMAAGLTQEALAERAGLSVHGIQKLERGVTRPYRDTMQRLVSGLDLGREEAERLRVAGAPQPRHHFGQAGSPWRFDMPVELTSFVGRESELARVTELLHSVRLLTLVGPGGVGKTRLAARLASRLMDCFRDGAVLVGLGNVSDAQTVTNAVATGLGITERGRTPLRTSLLEALRGRELLLVIDNCEHVLDGCAALAHDILLTCPGVTLLLTSREPLRVSGEVTWPVPPLSLDNVEVSSAATSEAVQLFVERARTVDPRFHLDQANRQAVIGICGHLEGLPLAIELAAARVRSMPVRRLLDDLQASSGVLPLLTGGPRDAPIRQQTLRATIAWSYELLSDDEQALFRRLAPFRGCTLAAVDAMCATPSVESRAASLTLTSLSLDARVGLESLVNRSLLRLEEDEQGQPWYVMLETVREFALEQLAATQESDAVWRRHTWYCLQLAKLSAPVLRGMRQSHQVRRLERELGNFRVALDWCQQHGYADASLRLAVDLLWLWGARGHIAEGRSRLEALLERFPLRTAHAPRVLVHASALQAVGRLATLQRDFGAAFAHQQQSLKLSEATGDAGSMCDALYGLGFAAHEQGDYAAAQKYLERGVELCRSPAPSDEAVTMFRLGQGLVGLGVLAHDQGDDHAARALFDESTIWFERAGDTVSVALNSVELGAIAQEGGDHKRARELIQHGLEVLEQIDEPRGVGIAIARLADAAIAVGDFSTAYQHLARCLQINEELGEPAGIAFVLVRFAHLAAAQGQAARALRLAGAAAALREEAQTVLAPVVQRRLEEQIAPARRALGRSAEGALRDGRALSLEAAIAEALATEAGEPESGMLDQLSPREREVATLIGRGYTNRRVAEELMIGEATVATHVQHILAKLELGSRAQIAVWADRRQLMDQPALEGRTP